MTSDACIDNDLIYLTSNNGILDSSKYNFFYYLNKYGLHYVCINKELPDSEELIENYLERYTDLIKLNKIETLSNKLTINLDKTKNSHYYVDSTNAIHVR